MTSPEEEKTPEQALFTKPPQDLLDQEINQDSSMFQEATRYTTLNKTLDSQLVKFHTQLSRRDIDLIMLKRNWLYCYKLSLAKLSAISKKYEDSNFKTINGHLEEIISFMELKVSEKGWRAKQLFNTLNGDEKKAMKWGLFGQQDRMDGGRID